MLSFFFCRILDSSGFEHVFVGETRKRSVTGFHSWIQFYLQEKMGKIDYRGYRDSGKVKDMPAQDVNVERFLFTLQIKKTCHIFTLTYSIENPFYVCKDIYQ